MTRHAGLHTTLAIQALTVAMIQPAFGALLMPAVGVAALLEPGLLAAIQAAIAVSAIAMLTDQEQRLATRAQPLPKHYFAVRRRHWSQRAGLDNGNRFVAP